MHITDIMHRADLHRCNVQP